MPLDARDSSLLEAARNIMKSRFQPGRHHVAAALRTKTGREFVAVNVEAYVGRISVCAEAIAIGMAAAAGDTDIETIVAINRLGGVVSPCGMCREMTSDYSPLARVIVPGQSDETEVVQVSYLLPNKYHRPD